MRSVRFIASLAAGALLGSAALAQQTVVVPVIKDQAGLVKGAVPSILVDQNGAYVAAGGGGGGSVTAAPGAYATCSIVDIGCGASPAANTLNFRLNQINTTLGTLLQPGGAVTVTGIATAANQVGTGTSAQTVQGAQAAGAAITANPILTAGSDGTNQHPTKTDTNGNLTITQAKATTTATGGTVTTGGTWQSILAASATRNGCLIQNQSSVTEYVWPGTPGSAPASAGLNAGGTGAIAVAAGGNITCGALGITISDQISMTSLTTGASYSEWVQ